jgi:hypothetical protein
MIFTIHFRGVAVFTRNDNHIKEVLFPNAETSLPPEGTKEKIKDKNENVLAEVMLHADGTPAPKHFAGALIVGPNGEITYRKLLHRHVLIIDDDSDGPEIKGSLRTDIPPLVDAITVPKYRLRLLDPGERSDPARVATRFSLSTGGIYSDQQSGYPWELDGGKRGGLIPARKFFVGAKLKIQAEEPFDIKVTDFTGKTHADETIRLDADHPEVYFYNFDSGMPSIADLTTPDHDDPDYEVDHDFKWVYQVLNRVSPDLDTWVKWLDGDPFPAPSKAFKGLITVSTCYQTVWPEG